MEMTTSDRNEIDNTEDVADALKELCRKFNVGEFQAVFKMQIGNHSITHSRQFSFRSKEQSTVTQKEFCELMIIKVTPL